MLNNQLIVHGLPNPSLKFHGFLGTHGSHANVATAVAREADIKTLKTKHRVMKSKTIVMHKRFDSKKYFLLNQIDNSIYGQLKIDGFPGNRGTPSNEVP